MDRPDLDQLPALIDVPTAAAVLGIGRSLAYDLVRTDRWPTPVLRVGKLIRIPTAALRRLLDPDTAAGSIRQIIGPSGATAGTGNLRALKAQTNTVVVNAASIKGLIDQVINLAQRSIDGDQATRRVARQTLRLAKAMVGDYSTADVGADTP